MLLCSVKRLTSLTLKDFWRLFGPESVAFGGLQSIKFDHPMNLYCPGYPLCTLNYKKF